MTIEAWGGAVDDTRVTVGMPAVQRIGQIYIEEVDGTAITAADFTLATSAALGGATALANTLNGTANNDTIDALAGNDTVNGGNGNDTIIGNWGTTSSMAMPATTRSSGTPTRLRQTDGRDVVNGGTEGGLGDTFIVNGNADSGNVQDLHAGGVGCLAGQQHRQPECRDGDRRHPQWD